MTTATTTGTGLDWVVFSDEEPAESCDYVSDPCSRQATHVATYRLVSGNCEHVCIRVLYCLVHRDWIMREAAQSGGLFCCHICDRAIVELVRMVTL